MNNTLYLSHANNASHDGWLANSLGLKLKEKGSVTCSIPDSKYISIKNHLENSNSSGQIDTIIQYLSIDKLEYHSNYKNIVVFNPKHFIFRKKSLINKLDIFDEVWVFEEKAKIFLSEYLDSNKIIMQPYPYIPQEVSKLFLNTTRTVSGEIFNFYTITDIYNQSNIENLIFNFVTTFYKINNIKLIIYINSEDPKTNIDTIIKNMISRIESSFSYINKNIIQQLITIIVGNIWLDKEANAKLHANGDCYINIDYLVNPHAITASYLQKYALSINDLDTILKFNSDFIIKCYRDSFKYKVNNELKMYYNEFNLYPKILDESIKEKYMQIYKLYKDNFDPRICYESLNLEK